jgi:hypothetical protein
VHIAPLLRTIAAEATMSASLDCTTRAILTEQISESVDAYAKITLEMLGMADVRSKEYAASSRQAIQVKSEVKYLKTELNSHYCDDRCARKKV